MAFRSHVGNPVYAMLCPRVHRVRSATKVRISTHSLRNEYVVYSSFSPQCSIAGSAKFFASRTVPRVLFLAPGGTVRDAENLALSAILVVTAEGAFYTIVSHFRFFLYDFTNGMKTSCQNVMISLLNIN